MPKRSLSQKHGSIGLNAVAAIISANPNWIVRRQTEEDFGIDLEAELSDPTVVGQLLKIQVKSTKRTIQKGGFAICRVKKQLLEYAYFCRLPVILTLADITRNAVWFLWLQGWLFERGLSERNFSELPRSVTLKIPLTQDLRSGLEVALKDTAAWRTKIQIARSLQDAFRTAISIESENTCVKLFEALQCIDSQFKEFPTDTVINEVLQLGLKIWATQEGNKLTQILFEICRTFGNRFTASQIRSLVTRNELYSRTGINALGILYETFPAHIKSLKLAAVFNHDDPRIVWYCTFRELNPGDTIWEIFRSHPNHTVRNIRLVETIKEDLFDKWANRGDSVFLDYLCATEPI